MSVGDEGRPVDLQLGLIGDNIAASHSPRLHRLAGAASGLAVDYRRLVPAVEGLGFAALFQRAQDQGFRGLNITYPYKETVVPLVTRSDDPPRLGAFNTVVFGPEGITGFNTDYSGFIAAYEGARPDRTPGEVALIGTGGVGRAVAFGLGRLGARALRLFDRDPARADAMAEDLRAAFPALAVTVHPGAEDAAKGATGIVNCTPVGMVGYPGTPVEAAAMAGAEWAFDAVYTPVDTQFLTDAAAAGLTVISGWELFFWQGVHAWRHFSGMDVDRAALRADLLAGRDAG